MRAFPSIEKKFFEKKTRLFKALLFMQILVENFSKIGLDSLYVLEVLFGIRESSDSYSGHTFNACYGSESIFNIFSGRIIALLSGSLSPDEQSLRKVIQCCGLARGVIDLFLGEKTSTEFGKLAFTSLVEPWGQLGPVRRTFELMLLSGMSLTDACTYKDKEVCHMPPDNCRSFLTPLCEALQNTEWNRPLSDFIYWFSVSSTFMRGQSAIMEWIYNAVTKKRKCKIKLKYRKEQKAKKYLLEKALSLPDMSTLGDSIGSFDELILLIQGRIKQQCAVPKPFCSAMLSHLDVVALNVSMRLTYGKQPETFFNFFKELVDIVEE